MEDERMGLGRTAGGLGITLMVVFLRASKSANCRYGIFNIIMAAQADDEVQQRWSRSFHSM